MNYTCPMHPEVVADAPGRCPTCGMNLVPLQKEHHGHHTSNKRSAKSVATMTWWEKMKMGLTMTMGMEHGGIAGREMAQFMEEDIRNKFWVSFVLTIPIVLYSPMGHMLLGTTLPSPIPTQWLLLLLTTPVFFYCGWIFLYSTYKALQQKNVNMAVLIAVGITAAYGFSIVPTVLGSQDSYYEAAAMLITFVLFGHWMEMKSRRGTTDALQALMNLVPPQARVLRNGVEVVIPTSEVSIGDTLILKPGDKVPVDGVVIEGETAIDESLVTGESLPVTKRIGDEVIGASINQSGSITFRATKVGDKTALAQIAKLVERAQNSKAPGQKLADKFAKYLVFAAIGGGVFAFIFWYFIMGESLLFALTFAISTIVIACPDALGLATPTAVAVGTGIGAKHNILIKDASTLEQVSQIQVAVFDKTGTLTEGKPKITDNISAKGFSSHDVLRFAAATEAKTSHPLSAAVKAAAVDQNILISENIQKFASLAGHGVEAIVDGKHILIGTVKLMQDRNIDIAPLRSAMTELLRQGKTIMLIAVDGIIAGVLGANDPIKPSALAAVSRMKELGLEVAMITGDNQKTAETIARQLDIKRVFSEVLPEDKARYIATLQEEGKFVAMVGDGINDAPALAQADIGIAIGAGTDVAIETAKVVLMKSDPADVLRAIRLSKATVAKMKQNLFWASIYNLLAIPVAAGILYPSFGISLRPEVSAFLMSISSIIVAVNAVLLKRVEKHLEQI